jgi:hypothetical protein
MRAEGGKYFVNFTPVVAFPSSHNFGTLSSFGVAGVASVKNISSLGRGEEALLTNHQIIAATP